MDQSIRASEVEASTRKLTGYALLLLVVVLWTGSSFITNIAFTDLDYNKPFLTTYLCTATFALYLIPPGWRYLQAKRSGSDGSEEEILAAKNDASSASGAYAYAPVSNPSGAYDSTSTLAVPGAGHAGERASDRLEPLTVRETARIALMFCAVWFSANVTINAALAQTSVSSVTILSSLSGLFTLVLGAFFKIETFNLVKLLAVIASILGVILVSAADNEITPAVADPAPTFDIRSALLLNDGEQKLPAHPLLGDLLALSSALCYAIYTLLLKAKTGDESRVSMTLFFGFVGAWNIVLFLPLLLIVNFTGLEPLQWPRSNELWVFLIVNAAITFVSDMAMMSAMLRTSPLSVTLGLSLTIPLAVFGDLIRGTKIGGWTLFAGGSLILGGFIAVGYSDASEVVEVKTDEERLEAERLERNERGSSEYDEERQALHPGHSSQRQAG